jgi:hypothetical protein
MVINFKYINIFSKLSVALFLAVSFIACGGGDGSGEGPIDDTTETGDTNNGTDNSITSENYVSRAAQVYMTMTSLGGIYAVKPLFSRLALYYEESGQTVSACNNSGEKNINAQKSGPERSLNPGDNMTVTYLQCDDGEGVQEGSLSIDIIENNEVSNTESQTLFDSVSSKTLNGVSITQNMRIKEEKLGEANVVGINSDRYEVDGSFRGNPNTTEHPAPHYENDIVRFSNMVFERYNDESISANYYYWDIESHDKENSDFSYTTIVLDDLRSTELGLSSGRYSVVMQGDLIEVTIAGVDNIQITLDRNSDGTVEEQQQMTANDFFAAGISIPE